MKFFKNPLLLFMVLLFSMVGCQTSQEVIDKDLNVSIVKTGETYTMKICQKYKDLTEDAAKANMQSMIQSRKDSLEKVEIIKEYDKHFTPSYNQAIFLATMSFFNGDWLLQSETISDTISIAEGKSEHGFLTLYQPNLLVLPYDNQAIALEMSQSADSSIVLAGKHFGTDITLSKLN